MNQLTRFQLLLILHLPILFIACREKAAEKGNIHVQIRLAAEPDRLHPLLSRSAYAEQVHRHLYLSLLNIDPSTLELRPQLATSRPATTKGAGGQLSLTFDLDPDATWSNGQAVTPEDVLFTLKMIFNPEVPVGHYRSFLNFIKSVELDSLRSGRLHFLCKESYLLSEAAIGLLPIFHKASFDPNDATDRLDLNVLLQTATESTVTASYDSLLKTSAARFVERLNPKGAEEQVLCGPYKVQEWQVGQYIRLQKQGDWWGASKAEERSALAARPDVITYRFIPDPQSALSLLKRGELDVMSDIPLEEFKQWQGKGLPSDALPFRLYTPLKLSYYLVALQNDHPILGEWAVRRALAHLLDLDGFIEQKFNGTAKRIIGPIHPSKPYYHSGLEAIFFDLTKASDLLEQSGWIDTDGDGIREKQMDGERKRLKLTYKVGHKNETGKEIGLMLQQQAAKVGIQLEMESRVFNTLLQEYRRGEFDLFYIAKGQLPLPDDLKQAWHSSSMQRGGSNRIGFGDAQTDALIDSIRLQLDPRQRNPLYLSIQEAIYTRQASIFLFSPKERIAIHERFDADVSILRPGYNPQEFTLHKAVSSVDGSH
ncbi:MAG: ABC transporter substrate-binding protein [Bacteroidota bacterium]